MSREEINRALFGRRRNKRVEAGVQGAVLDWLNTLPEVAFWRRNVGAMTVEEADGSKRFVQFNAKGMADTWGVVRTIHAEIEIKRPGEHPDFDQTAWLDLMRQRGCIAFWCDSIETCIEQLRYEYQQRGWDWKPSWEVL